MDTKTNTVAIVKKILITVGFFCLVPMMPWFNIQTATGGEWAWSLRLAIHELRFYPDQLFPDIVYPVDWDVVVFPQPINESTIHVPQGSIVTWVNKDRNPSDEEGELNIIPHLIRITDHEGNTVSQSLPLLKWEQTFTATFDKIGDFKYVCMFHPNQMRGDIQVLPWGMELVQRK